MKVKDIIKKQTTIIAVAVVLVVVATISVSYAIFFDVKSNEQNQVIKAGTLKLNLKKFTALNLETAISTSEGLETDAIEYDITNDGDLPATYSLYIYATKENNIPIKAIKFSIDGTAEKGTTATNLNEELIDANMPENTNEDGIKYYKIDTGNVEAKNKTTSKYLRVWVDEDGLTEEIEAGKLELKLYLVSEVQE